MNYILPWIIIKHMQEGNISINLHNTLVASGNSLGDIGLRFANWSIVYLNVVLDCSGPLQQHPTCWTSVSIGQFTLVTKIIWLHSNHIF